MDEDSVTREGEVSEGHRAEEPACLAWPPVVPEDERCAPVERDEVEVSGPHLLLRVRLRGSSTDLQGIAERGAAVPRDRRPGVARERLAGSRRTGLGIAQPHEAEDTAR